MNETINSWCVANMHMLECLSPIDIVIAWEEYRKRTAPATSKLLARAAAAVHSEYAAAH